MLASAEPAARPRGLRRSRGSARSKTVPGTVSSPTQPVCRSRGSAREAPFACENGKTVPGTEGVTRKRCQVPNAVLENGARHRFLCDQPGSLRPARAACAGLAAGQEKRPLQGVGPENRKRENGARKTVPGTVSCVLASPWGKRSALCRGPAWRCDLRGGVQQRNATRQSGHENDRKRKTVPGTVSTVSSPVPRKRCQAPFPPFPPLPASFSRVGPFFAPPVSPRP